MSEKEKVFDVLQKHNRMSIDEISEEIHSGKKHCGECHSILPGYDDTREDVREGLRKLMDEGKVGSTPDWKYYIPQRFLND